MRNDLNVSDLVIFELEKSGTFVGRIINKTLNIFKEVIYEAIVFGCVNSVSPFGISSKSYCERGSCVILDNCFAGIADFDNDDSDFLNQHLEPVLYSYYDDSLDLESMSVLNLLLLHEYNKIQKSMNQIQDILMNRCDRCMQRIDLLLNDHFFEKKQTKMYIIYPLDAKLNECETLLIESKPGYKFFDLYELEPETNGIFRFESGPVKHHQYFQKKSHWFCSIKKIGRVLFHPTQRTICRLIPHDSRCVINYDNVDVDEWMISLIYQKLPDDKMCGLADNFFDFDKTSFILHQSRFDDLFQQVTKKMKQQLKNYLIQFLKNHLNDRLKIVATKTKDKSNRKISFKTFSKCWDGFNFKDQLTMCKFGHLTKAIILKTLLHLFQSNFFSFDSPNF